ncbi:MAG: single-stranded DNA-binding protein [Bacteroidales bacterium]|nr:single-stranded DNA-binding protein [Bacteroidales bacterium]
MAGINKVILVGFLGKDPEVITFENGVKKATVSMATTESYKNKEGNWIDQTDWHNVVLWRWLAEKNLIKGDQVYVEGKVKTRSYDDKDGNKKYITEIVADKILKLGRKEQTKSEYDDIENAPIPEQSGPEDDLPF